jgi:hypothetical protein
VRLVGLCGDGILGGERCFSVQSTPGTVTVGGSLWIDNVTPGGDVQFAGTVVSIDGAGFDPAGMLSVDDVSTSAVQSIRRSGGATSTTRTY